MQRTAMDLEVLSRPSAEPGRRPPLLFVHGIAVGAWVWDEHVLPFFAAAGFDAHALSLRGHGGSGGGDGLARWTLADYAADLAAAVGGFDRPPVVIGHSLGGAVVQRWVKDGGRPAGVALLASVPPWGLGPSAWRMGLNSPALLAEVLKLTALGPERVDPGILRAGLFSADLPDEACIRFAHRVGGESAVVGAELQGWPPFTPLPWQMPRCFVLGGADDRFVPSEEVWLTGLYYGVQSVIVPRLAHALMLDTRWRDAAEPLLGWLRAAHP